MSTSSIPSPPRAVSIIVPLYGVQRARSSPVNVSLVQTSSQLCHRHFNLADTRKSRPSWHQCVPLLFWDHRHIVSRAFFPALGLGGGSCPTASSTGATLLQPRLWPNPKTAGLLWMSAYVLVAREADPAVRLEGETGPPRDLRARRCFPKAHGPVL